MTRPASILHIQGSFDLGGKEARSVRLINIWGTRARHSFIIGNPAMRGAMAEIADGVEAHIMEDAPSIMGVPNWRSLWAIGRAMRGHDLVLSYNWGAMNAVLAHRLLRRTLRLPALIHHEDGFNADEAARLDGKRNLFRRHALPGAYGLVVPSCQLAHIAISAWGQPADKVHHIPNGIDVSAYARSSRPDAIAGLDRTDGRIVVGTLAGLRAVKNLRRLVRVAAPVAERITLVVVGEGPERDVIAAEAAAHGVTSLIMPGFLPRPQDYIGLFDIFALTSDSEQFPISLVEAMAAGLPVVATDVGDVAAMLPPGNRAFLYAPDDEAGLARALETLVGDATLRITLGAANRHRAQEAFDGAGMVARYAELYDEAMGRRVLST